MCHFEVLFDGLLNVAYWLDSVIGSLEFDVCLCPSFRHPRPRSEWRLMTHNGLLGSIESPASTT